MIDLHFDQPQWIHLTWAVLAFVLLLLWLNQCNSHRLNQFLSNAMQQRLVNRPTNFHRIVGIAFLGLAGIFLVLALMRPQSGLRYASTPRTGAQIMISLDVSRSMLATDVTPNRLNRAKAEIQDLLTYLDQDHVGLIAFAGKATVLCPLTPDFGFLRLILQSAGPHSVSRGGTNLEAPLRKAIDGFHGQSDLSRAVILITDGDDHDSHVLDAAKAAGERGIHIIAIGLGDKAGSQIFVTNSQTGIRTPVLDENGTAVVSRLGGQLLRKLALETNGVYIPAGTGALDLKSIYDAHIAPLTRGRLDDQGRWIKQEQYQWAILLALCCLTAALVISNRRSTFKPRPPNGVSVALGLTLATILIPTPAKALDRKEGQNHNPRKLYNEGSNLLNQGQLEEAKSKLDLARQHAGADGQVRFRATYNLAWVDIKQAEVALEDQPKQALESLYTAASWFREAIRLAPAEMIARENLEIVSNRALQLADSLAHTNESTLAEELDNLINQQRQVVELIQPLVQNSTHLDQEKVSNIPRGKFRNIEVEQRKCLAHTNQIAQSARDESEKLNAFDDQKQHTSQQKIRATHLHGVQTYLHQAAQRMNQGRQHLRASHADRAYRRASAAMRELKRARDQLRNLAELLTTLISDATRLAQHTAVFTSAVPTLSMNQNKDQHKPDWLTREYLSESLATVRARTNELATRIESGLTSQGLPPKAEDPNTDEANPLDNEGKQQFLDILHEALPLVQGAYEDFTVASNNLASHQDTKASQSKIRGIGLLSQAHELFLDIRGLIELVHSNQRRIQGILQYNQEEQNTPVTNPIALIKKNQSKNTGRLKRLDALFDLSLSKLATSVPSTPDTPTTPTTFPKIERQQLELAKQLVGQIQETFSRISQSSASSETDEFDQINSHLAIDVNQSINQIETLRRLFFSLVEHLRDTVRRQAEVMDQTRDILTLNDPAQAVKTLMPLATRQKDLANISDQIAQSLQKQSEQSPLARQPNQRAHDHTKQSTQHGDEQIQQAANYVTHATRAMTLAHSEMEQDSLDAESIHDHQQEALDNSLAALKLLEPSRRKNPPEENHNQQEPGGENPPHNKSGQTKEDKQQPNQRFDLNQLLQTVRDREAQRQHNRNRQAMGHIPVSRDW